MVTPQAAGGGSLLGAGLSPLVGRDGELQSICARLASARLVTLTGPGGSGKTRLALEVSERLRAADARPVHVAALGALRDPALLPAAIAHALGLRATGSRTPLEVVVRHLGSEDRVLVLDNLEQLLPAGASTVRDLLASCAGLRVLATSQVPLNLRAEHVVRVEPLPVPSVDEDLAGLVTIPSVALFLERASARGVELHLDASVAATVGAICRHLDGLPLALELAAARLSILSPTALLSRLEEGLGVLAGGPLDAPERQRTLRDTIAWSVDLLPGREQALFVRLGVFAAGCDLGAASAIAAPGIVETDDELLDVMGSLVDHSLLRVTEPAHDGETRFSMLETVREYALERLDQPELVRDRHLAYYLALAEAAGAVLEGPSRRSRARRLHEEAENLRAALDRAENTGRTDVSLRLVAALAFYWREHGDLHEGRERLERAISRAGSDASVSLAAALIGLSRITMVLGDRQGGQVLAQRAFEVASAVGDDREAARALLYRAMGAADEGKLDLAADLLASSLAVARASGEPSLVSYCLLILGKVAWHRCDHEGARRSYEESALIARGTDDAVRMGIPVLKLGRLHVLAFEDASEGLELIESAVRLLQEADTPDYLGLGLLDRGQARCRLGQLDEARADIREGLRLVSHNASPDDEIEALEVMADWLGTAGVGDAALRAWGADERAREDLGSSISPGERAWMKPLWARDRRAVGEPRATLAWQAGRSIDIRQAVAAAREAMDGAHRLVEGARTVAPRGARLTPREVEVLSLLAAGCSDGEIAERLFISKKTASVHVANLKGKLGTGNRVETALAAVRMGLVPPPE